MTATCMLLSCMCPVQGMYSFINVQCADSTQLDPKPDVVAEIICLAFEKLHNQYPNLLRHFVQTSLAIYADREESAELLYNHHIQVHTYTVFHCQRCC